MAASIFSGWQFLCQQSSSPCWSHSLIYSTAMKKCIKINFNHRPLKLTFNHCPLKSVIYHIYITPFFLSFRTQMDNPRESFHIRNSFHLIHLRIRSPWYVLYHVDLFQLLYSPERMVSSLLYVRLFARLFGMLSKYLIGSVSIGVYGSGALGRYFSVEDMFSAPISSEKALIIGL